jgi:hypothetical protein
VIVCGQRDENKMPGIEDIFKTINTHTLYVTNSLSLETILLLKSRKGMSQFPKITGIASGRRVPEETCEEPPPPPCKVLGFLKLIL